MPADILSNNYSTQQVFLGKKFFTTGTFVNSSGSTINLVPGQLLGRVLSNGNIALCIAANTDGSEMPRFLCADNYSIPNNGSATIQLCTRAEVNENAITLNSTDTLSTVVRTVSTGGGTLRDLLLANTEIMLVPSTELSGYDN